MKVEIVVDPTRRTLAERVGPPPAVATEVSTGVKGPKPISNRGGGRGKGNGRGGRGGGRRNNKSAADLDEEMEVWAKEAEPTAA